MDIDRKKQSRIDSCDDCLRLLSLASNSRHGKLDGDEMRRNCLAPAISDSIHSCVDVRFSTEIQEKKEFIHVNLFVKRINKYKITIKCNDVPLASASTGDFDSACVHQFHIIISRYWVDVDHRTTNEDILFSFVQRIDKWMDSKRFTKRLQFSVFVAINHTHFGIEISLQFNAFVRDTIPCSSLDDTFVYWNDSVILRCDDSWLLPMAASASLLQLMVKAENAKVGTTFAWVEAIMRRRTRIKNRLLFAWHEIIFDIALILPALLSISRQ